MLTFQFDQENLEDGLAQVRHAASVLCPLAIVCVDRSFRDAYVTVSPVPSTRSDAQVLLAFGRYAPLMNVCGPQITVALDRRLALREHCNNGTSRAPHPICRTNSSQAGNCR